MSGDDDYPTIAVSQAEMEAYANVFAEMKKQSEQHWNSVCNIKTLSKMDQVTVQRKIVYGSKSFSPHRWPNMGFLGLVLLVYAAEERAGVGAAF